MENIKRLFLLLTLLVSISISVSAQVPLANNMPASGVLGTTDFVTNTNYAAPTASTLAEPFCVAVDPTTGKLFVADRDNRRVLRWSSAAKMINGAAAEAVFGQPDFVTRTANTGGISAATMNNPNSVHVDATGTLWVADRDNHRILRFNNASSKASSAAADGVLGQPDFVTNTLGTTAAKVNAPASVFGDAAGNLWVADRANNRVLKFTAAASKPNGAAADVVLGQADFVTGTSGTSSTTMNAPWGVFVDGNGRLWVAERSNNRVTRFDNAASLANGAAANGVLGQNNFTSSTSGLAAEKFDGPRGVFMDGLGRLYVGDEGNSRIIVFNNAATKPNGSDADYVLGQPNFTTTGSATTQTGLNYPSTVFIDNPSNHIWVPDTYSHRILRFDVSPIPVELVSFKAGVTNGVVTLNWSTASETNNNGFEIQKRENGAEYTAVGFVKGAGTSTAPNSYTFTDNATSTGKYTYRLKQIDFGGAYEYSSEVEVDIIAEMDFALNQNYPNPFNPSTTIQFVVPEKSFVRVSVTDVLGNEVAILANGETEAGSHSLEFNASNLPSGVYFCILQAGQFSESKKMILMK